jgi:AraC-like DNA-binding protein
MEKKQPLLVHQTFNDANLMEKSSLNWEYDTVYKLMPNALEGENSVILMPTLQLSYAKRNGGILYNTIAPKGTVSVGIVSRSDGKACFGHTKLKEGDILFFNDKQANTLIASDFFEASIISIPRQHYRKYTKILSTHIGQVIRDTEGVLHRKMAEILAQMKQTDKQSTETLRTHEEILLSILDNLLLVQTPYQPKLTKGEKIALQIRDRIYKRITKKVTISSLAEEFGVSEQTLQNAFKSLFGMTPNRFLRNLKLNHVRKALLQAKNEEETIVHIANRWGFTHMGHFSRYYTDLFWENPSITLQREPLEKR